MTAIAVLLIALSGCAGKPAPSAAPTASPSTPAAAPATTTPAVPVARTAKWIDLKAGDCLAGLPPVDPAVTDVTVVDCGSPHLSETYLRADIPVNAAITDTANSQCQAGLAQYTGGQGGPYTVSYLIDSEQDRTSNNPLPSTVICLLQSAQGQPLTGSARR